MFLIRQEHRTPNPRTLYLARVPRQAGKMEKGGLSPWKEPRLGAAAEHPALPSSGHGNGCGCAATWWPLPSLQGEMLWTPALRCGLQLGSQSIPALSAAQHQGNPHHWPYVAWG